MVWQLNATFSLKWKISPLSPSWSFFISIHCSLSYTVHNSSLLTTHIIFLMLVQKAQHLCRAPLVQRAPVAPGMHSGVAKWNQDVLSTVLIVDQRPPNLEGTLLGSTFAPSCISLCFTETYAPFRWHVMSNSQSWQCRGDMFITSSTHEPWWICKVLCSYKINAQITRHCPQIAN